MKKVILTIVMLGAIVWLPARVVGVSATNYAQSTAGENYCWLESNPDGSRSEPDLLLSRDCAVPFRFWTALLSRPKVAGHKLPHFALVIPSAEAGQQVLGWSFKGMKFWSLEEQVSALGLFWAPQDCLELLKQE